MEKGTKEKLTMNYRLTTEKDLYPNAVALLLALNVRKLWAKGGYNGIDKSLMAW